MENFKQRLIEEQKQLEEKIEKLGNFINSDKLENVGINDQRLFPIQYSVMKTYNEILK